MAIFEYVVDFNSVEIFFFFNESLKPKLSFNGKLVRKINASLGERLRTHKVFTIHQWFYLNYYKSIKSNVVDVY